MKNKTSPELHPIEKALALTKLSFKLVRLHEFDLASACIVRARDLVVAGGKKPKKSRKGAKAK